MVPVWAVELSVVFTGFLFHPGLFSACPAVWEPPEAAGKPLQPCQSPTEDTRAAGGCEEDAAKREPLSTGMEREGSEKKKKIGGKMEIRDFSDLKKRETTKH